MTAQPVMTPELFELAKALKSRRFQLGLTQRELATKLGCAQTLVSMWESGRRGISFAALTNWAEVLGGEVQLNLSFPPVERVVIKKNLLKTKP
jgi:transcriptional regulator with XRE-family HTH domain